ncbi:MAG TPA: diacylglycerol kinase family protein, partial [Solirubrobacterales bacterium]|nr:diacylglycerol kinase family protein [Solirubrobacterales bacterium]
MVTMESRPADKTETGSRAAAVLVLVNANASGAGSQARLRELAGWMREAGGEVELVRTGSVEELAAIWREDDGRRVVLVGGDGTVHEVANFDGPAREVALIPAGKANNIAHSLGIPTEWREAARLAVSGEARPVDLIEARAGEARRLVVEGVSVGFLAQARVRYRGRNSGAVLAALRAGAAALEHFHPLAARVQHHDGREALHLSQLFVANLPLYEFGLRVAPFADPTDARLDVIGIEAPSRRAVLRMLLDL